MASSMTPAALEPSGVERKPKLPGAKLPPPLATSLICLPTAALAMTSAAASASLKSHIIRGGARQTKGSTPATAWASSSTVPLPATWETSSSTGWNIMITLWPLSSTKT